MDVVLDGIDVYAQPARLLLYRRAREAGIPVLFGAPLGLSGTVGAFVPGGMRYEDYFDLHEGLSPFETMIRFIVGLAPQGRHWSYMRPEDVQPDEHAGSSSAAAISLITGMVCTETLVALLKRRPLRAAPEFTQYDPYLGIFRHGRLRWGNRGPLQRLKLRFIASKFADKIETFNHTGFQPMPGTAPDA